MYRWPSSPEVTVEVQVRGAAIWYPAAGPLVMPFSYLSNHFQYKSFLFCSLLSEAPQKAYLSPQCFAYSVFQLLDVKSAFKLADRSSGIRRFWLFIPSQAPSALEVRGMRFSRASGIPKCSPWLS